MCRATDFFPLPHTPKFSGCLITTSIPTEKPEQGSGQSRFQSSTRLEYLGDLNWIFSPSNASGLRPMIEPCWEPLHWTELTRIGCTRSFGGDPAGKPNSKTSKSEFVNTKLLADGC